MFEWAPKQRQIVLLPVSTEIIFSYNGVYNEKLFKGNRVRHCYFEYL